MKDSLIEEYLIKEYLILAYSHAKYSTCKDKQVGCVLLSQNRLLVAFGYNKVIGTCKGCGNFCPAVHAEMAALIDCTFYPYTVVCTLEPCIECTKALVLAGVREIYYGRPTNPRKSGRQIFASFVSNEIGRWELISNDNWGYSELSSDNGPTTETK